MKQRLLVCGVAVLGLRAAMAFELTTHGILTYQAYQKSALISDTTLLPRLGVDRDILAASVSKEPFGDTYLELSLTGDRDWIANRLNQNLRIFDRDAMPTVPGQFDPANDSLTLPGWLMRGAIREDDDPKESEPNPKDDTPSGLPIHRVFHHFFDPATNRALNIYAGEPFAKNPDWATGYINSFSASLTRNTTSENFFSLLKAREAMFRALTLRAMNDDGTLRELDPGASLPPSDKQALRKRYWATTFRSLGDAVHLVQDMAQPQHTRNEPHAGLGPYLFQPLLAGHKSVFENYIEARLKGDSTFTVKNYSTGDKEVQISTSALQLPDYPTVPAFGRYSDYWSVNPGSADRSGKGLADYSNRGFFTAAKNLGNNEYPLPDPSPGAYSVSMEPVTKWDGTPLDPSSGSPLVRILRGTVTDTLDSARTANDVAMSTSSGWDQFLEFYVGTLPQFTLNHVNYDEHARLLLPRAAAYSAGLINYFFRGSMEIGLPDEKVYGIADHSTTGTSGGFTKLRVKIKNMTPKAGAPGEVEAMDLQLGGLYAVAKFHRNTCYAADLSREYGSEPLAGCRSIDEEIVVSERAENVPVAVNSTGGDVTFNFTTPVPISAADLFLQVIYRGRLGNELDAVVVATKDISEPTYYPIFDLYEQQNYGTAGSPRTWKDAYCDNPQPPLTTGPMEYTACKYYYRNNYYLRFASPVNFDPADAVASFNPLVTMPNIPVSSFARIAILTDVGPYTAYTLNTKIDPPAWGQGTFTAAKNQWNYETNSLDKLRYRQARGVYVEDLDYADLTTGTLLTPPAYSDINPLTPLPSNVASPFN